MVPSSNISADWQPPTGFVPVDSKIPGIQVYAPAPVVEKVPEEQTFTCPNCGATTAFDPDAASVTCSHCGYVQKLHADVVGEAAPAAEFTVSTLQGQQRGWGQERRELHCNSCGADLSIEANDLSTTCPFCASNQVINRATQKEGVRPGFLIPFKIDRTACVQNARAWLGRGWMYPSDLSGVGQQINFQGIYLPFWTFSAQISAKWEAEVGYERTERYYDAGSKSWQTRTVIDWRWQSGQVEVPIRDLLGMGAKNISPHILAQIEPYDLSSLTAYDPGFLAGWKAKSYDIPLQPAWDAARVEMREHARDACMEDIPTHHVRNFSMSADFNDESWRLILLPVYLATYQFAQKTYQVMVNGQTGSVAGQKPVAWWKVWLAIAALLIPGAVIGLIGLPFVMLGGAGVIPVVVGIFLFIVGLVISGIILNKAMHAGQG
ncbi:MAG: TFIIB-type zinc ribbon-containing protein [Chloroflexi bacterium]|nr:TFIIB-type zinc ribbon-containing protein [Chloroflexota bacterium]